MEATKTKPNKQPQVKEVLDDLDKEVELLLEPEVEVLEELEEEDDEYLALSKFEPVFWNGNILKPAGIVAMLASETPVEKQVQDCQEIMIMINKDKVPMLETLTQAHQFIISFILHILRTREAKVVYRVGAGSGVTELMANNLGDKMLVLHGKVEPMIQVPNAMQLPEAALHPKKTKITTMVQFQQ